MESMVGVILAAGKGKRMISNTTKVLHKIWGLPLIEYVIRILKEVGIKRKLVIVSPGDIQLFKDLLQDRVEYVIQHEPLGTGHAILQAKEALSGFEGTILVVCGDTPLLKAEELTALVKLHVKEEAVASILTALYDCPHGYGRIVRCDEGRIERIVEEKDATSEEKKIREVNTGTYCFDSRYLFSVLPLLGKDNVQQEYYLTDVIEYMAKHKKKIVGFISADPQSTQGINTRAELSRVARIIGEKIKGNLMVSGVTMIDPQTVFIDETVSIGKDTIIYPFSILEGNTVVEEECVIGPYTHLVDTRVCRGAVIENSVARGAIVGENCRVGPYSYLRPGAILKERVKVGDFVEIKKSTIGAGSKLSHLSYVGDTIIGEKVNIGAGTITCNYDGKGKYQTIIEDEVFIGSNTSLRAPLKVGKGAITGAGSVVLNNIEPNTVVAGVPAKPIRKKERNSLYV